MEFPAHIVFSCLLVCQSAIFVDSKRGGKQSFPKAEGTSRWLLWMLRKVNVLVDVIGWESFCEELMERMDEDALDAVCDRIAPRYGVELAGSRYAA